MNELFIWPHSVVDGQGESWRQLGARSQPRQGQGKQLRNDFEFIA